EPHPRTIWVRNGERVVTPAHLVERRRVGETLMRARARRQVSDEPGADRSEPDRRVDGRAGDREGQSGDPGPFVHGRVEQVGAASGNVPLIDDALVSRVDFEPGGAVARSGVAGWSNRRVQRGPEPDPARAVADVDRAADPAVVRV